MADVGEALVGPFDKYLSEWDKMRQTPIDNRTNEPWPTVALPGDRSRLEQTPTTKHLLDMIGMLNPDNIDIPPITSKLQLDAGARDVAIPSKEEMMQYLMTNEATGPDPSGPEPSQQAPQAQVPLPRPRPRGR